MALDTNLAEGREQGIRYHAVAFDYETASHALLSLFRSSGRSDNYISGLESRLEKSSYNFRKAELEQIAHYLAEKGILNKEAGGAVVGSPDNGYTMILSANKPRRVLKTETDENGRTRRYVEEDTTIDADKIFYFVILPGSLNGKTYDKAVVSEPVKVSRHTNATMPDELYSALIAHGYSPENTKRIYSLFTGRESPDSNGDVVTTTQEPVRAGTYYKENSLPKPTLTGYLRMLFGGKNPHHSA